jgi:hypothetical protein
MGLDGQVRCRCIQDGLAKPHPFPERLTLDEALEPVLTGKPTLEEWLVHEGWFKESCPHSGYLAEQRLGNISAIAHIRELLSSVRGQHTWHFPILQSRVVHSGSQSGDYLSSDKSAGLLNEVEEAEKFNDSWDACDREFFASVRRLCEASIERRNPIVF